ncbi:MAG: hypothetical protein ABIQ61_13800 [Ornithinibacter sp.]
MLETFGVYATTWVATRELKPKTREGYEHLLGKYLAPAFGPRAIVGLAPVDVRKLWATMDPNTPPRGPGATRS